MKKTILLSSIFAVGAALATDVDSTVIGTLPVEVAKGQQLMAVPFADNANGEIAVNDMVKTSDLVEGDKLYVANDNGYDMWELKNNVWVSAKKVTIGSDGQAVESETPAANTATVKRGDAFWLETKKEGVGHVTLLGGKSAATPAVAVANKWNLISNPTIKSKTLAGGVNGDKVAVPSLSADGYLTIYTYKTGSGWWYADSKGRHTGEEILVEAGKGVWYYAAGSDRELW